MRILYASLSSICIFGVALLCGCGGATQNAGFTPGPTTNSNHVGKKAAVAPGVYTGARDLYVADAETNSIKILKNRSYAELGQITAGIDNPESVFLDRHGNLYVANNSSDDVTEYAPNSTTPLFIYNDQMSEALLVTADAHDNVFVVDDVSDNILQYFQQSNTLTAKCSPGLSMSGIAVDSSNDVFTSDIGGELVEYPGGLAGCNKTVLGASPKSAFGMTVDKHNDLVVCDALAGTVDVIAPPYSSVTRTFGSSLVEPVNVTLNRDNNLAFVVDYSKDVQVYDFQTGTLVTTLGTPYGLSSPISAVDGPNAVY